ncbi:capsular exopolysaccharide family [Caldithrix abyssi DSM 13497]|uniref:Capsular exopolysaccharide family n=1 Tax=Caldithrix abyssi DSM 13497 TaxID=880073 RepID=H1XXC2_CALAY|nr:tyrosine-protein kinase family protein [Caldithrix abyssi]APF17840.1 capsular exopolysaccharide family [Caldithrix abyssi DSM 13497]EHO41907.1 capsular exopolysaccharide family [Caldithrix abyssi DSM 13497]
MNNQKKSTDLNLTDSKMDWQHYIKLFKRKKWLMLLLFIFGFLFSAAFLYKISPRPVYQTQALLQFQDTRSLNELDSRRRPDFESKLGILMSRKFLGKIVDDLSLVVRFSGVDRYEAVDSVFLHPNYLKGRFVLKKQGNKLLLFYTSQDHSIEDKKVLEVDYPEDRLIVYGGVGLKLKDRYWQQHDKLIYTVNSRPRAIESLLSSLGYQFKNRARTLLVLTLKGEDRYLITATLNKIVDYFVQENLNLKKYQTREVLSVLEEQLQTAKVELDRAAQELKQFREKNPWVGLTPDATGAISSVSALESQKSQLVNLKNELQSLINRLQAKSGEERYSILNEIISFLGAQDAPTAPALASEFTTLTTDRSRLLASYAPSHPYVKENTKKLNELEKKVLLTAQNMINAWNKQINDLEQKIVENTNKIKRLPAKELKLAELERQRAVTDEIYSSLLVRYNQAKIADAVEVGDVVVLDRAVVPLRISQFKTYFKIMLIGLVVGLGLSVVVVIVIDFFDKTVRSAEELEKAIPIKVIGKIPVIKTEKEIVDVKFDDAVRIDPKLVTADYSPTPVGEAYRSLRTQLLFNSDKKLRSVFITSLNPDEGKSLNAGNLAITFAQQKLPTILLDADLRRGVLHNSFACKKKPGFSDFLYSNADITDENVRKIIQTTHIPNLYLISSGVPIPNPSELLGSTRAQELIRFLSHRFGFVIIDTPPLAVASDAVIVSRYVDGGLLVVRAGKSNIVQLKSKIEEYQDLRKNLVGIVLNFAKEDMDHKKYRYTYYNY